MRVDVDGAQRVVHADARAAGAGHAGVFDLAAPEGHAEVAGVLIENFSKCAAARKRTGEHLLTDCLGDHAVPPQSHTMYLVYDKSCKK